MKFLFGLMISFAVGVFCRYFDLPVGSPSVLPGAVLVLAMTLGYSSANMVLHCRGRVATASCLRGSANGEAAATGKASDRRGAEP